MKTIFTALCLLLISSVAFAQGMTVYGKDGTVIKDVISIEAQGDDYILEICKADVCYETEFPAHNTRVMVGEMELQYRSDGWWAINSDGWGQKLDAVKRR